jgi:hypothetical protein
VEEFAPRLTKVVNNTTRFAITTHAPPGALHDLGLSITEAIDQGTSIKATLDRIAVSDDPYGKALASAMCTGLGQLAQYENDPNAQPATQETWRGFLIAQVKVLLPNNPLVLIQTKVGQLTSTASLAQINPRLAATYFRECT